MIAANLTDGVIDFLLIRFEEHRDSDAIIWREKPYTYAWLRERVDHWVRWIAEHEIQSGAVVALEADFSPNSTALFIALTGHRCVLVPLTSSVANKRHTFVSVSQTQWVISVNDEDNVSIERLGTEVTHPFLTSLQSSGTPGLILFSSGSTGESKAAVHDLAALLNKFRVPRHPRRAISFLLFDHIGGVNTMFYQLSNGGTIVTVRQRDPDTVLGAIDRHRVELLPTSPTFLNLVLLSEAYTRHSLDSLVLVTYGTEPMPESTLLAFHDKFPKITLLQTYGLSEVGILRSKSKSSDSLWVKIGGEGFQTRVVDGILQIKAESAMKGYLNAASPFTDDGWFNTNDVVDVDGDYFRFRGRKSEIINVGGEKVYPAEVENTMQQFPGVSASVVFGTPNAITGQMVCAKINIEGGHEPKAFVKELKKYCKERMVRYQVPVKIEIVDENLTGERWKKLRS